MRLPALIFLCALAAAGSEPETTSWATVPASTLAGRLETFPLPGPVGDGVVALVGATGRPDPLAPAPVQMLSLDLPQVAAAGEEPQGPDESLEELPPGTAWPGPDGRISVGANRETRAAAESLLRNPWENRVHPRRELTESIFVSGGIISGGSGGPVALLNGRVAQKGSTVDGFEVALVANSAVLLTKDGCSYAVPLGRRVAIEIAQP
jgi:hypothetical protein